MKKYVVVILLICLIAMFPKTTFAADVLYRMLHTDEEFKQDQDAMIVGQLIDKQGDKFKVKVLKVLSGNVSSDSILVSDDFNYGWGKETPSVNNFGVFSLKKSGVYYKKALGIFEATNGDYKTLQLKSRNTPITGNLGELAAIQWYVNTGGTEKDFYFEGNIAFVKRPNDQVVQIYPIPTTGEETVVYNDFNYVIPIIVVLVGIGTTLLVRLRKGKVKL